MENVILEWRQASRQVLSCSWLDEASLCLHEFVMDLIDASQQPLAWRCWCVWRLFVSEVTWVASHWLISHLSDSSPAPPSSCLKMDRQVFYTEQVRIIPFASFSGHSPLYFVLERFHFFFFFCVFAAALLSSSHNIARIPIEPLCTTKFKAIFHNMPEIAVQTLAVLQRRCLDEQEVVRCHQYNKQGFCLYPLLFHMPVASGAA